MTSSPPALPSIAFLGLGLMGTGMARRLLAANFPLSVYNRNADKSAPFAAAGARVAASPHDAAASADIVISMLADDKASRALWLGDQGALGGTKSGTVLVECSTVSVGWVKDLAAAAAARGCELIDAPVTGSKPQAAAGELTFLVGGTAATLEKIRPALAVMSRAIIHLGPSGSGALLKLVNNFLCGVQAASLAEAIGLIEHAGLDRAQALEVLGTGAPGSPLLRTFAGRMTAQSYEPNFLLRLMAKDLAYAWQEGNRHSVDLKTAAAALEVFQRAVDAGLGEKDVSAVVEPFRQR